MDEEFKKKLKEAFEALDGRVRQLEHLVNDVVIGSLESAANEYADNEAFNGFKGKYGEKLSGLVEPYKKLFGEDYDLERELYDDLKNTEGYGSDEFDEEACILARIEDLQGRIDSLKEEVKEEVKEDVSEEEEKAEEEEPEEPEEKVEVEEISEEQLAKELEDALKEGASV